MRTLVLLLLLAALSGCAVATPPATPSVEPPPPTATHVAGTGWIEGTLVTPFSEWPAGPVLAFAASYLGPADGEGVFVLDANLHPHAPVSADGAFRIENVPPGTYVLVFGSSVEDGVAYTDKGRALRFDVRADEGILVGEVRPGD